MKPQYRVTTFYNVRGSSKHQVDYADDPKALDCLLYRVKTEIPYGLINVASNHNGTYYDFLHMYRTLNAPGRREDIDGLKEGVF